MDVSGWLAGHPAPPAQRKPRSFEINFSRLRAYLECPWQYKLRFIDGRPQPPTPASSLGLTIHRALESFHREDASDPARLFELYDRHFHHAGFADPQAKEQCYRKGEELLRRYLKAERERRTRIVGVEREFLFELGPHQVRGMIDRIDEHPDGRFEILDYKTGEPPALGERGEEGAFFEDLQLRIYGLGAREALALEPTWLTVYYLGSGSRRSVPYEPGREEELRALLGRVADLMAEGKGFAPDLSFCRFCIFRRGCQFSAVR